jgi:hypothetical protein
MFEGELSAPPGPPLGQVFRLGVRCEELDHLVGTLVHPELEPAPEFPRAPEELVGGLVDVEVFGGVELPVLQLVAHLDLEERLGGEERDHGV